MLVGGSVASRTSVKCHSTRFEGRDQRPDQGCSVSMSPSVGCLSWRQEPVSGVATLSEPHDNRFLRRSGHHAQDRPACAANASTAPKACALPLRYTPMLIRA